MIRIWAILIPFLLFAAASFFNQEQRKKAWIIYAFFSVLYAVRGEIGVDWQHYLEYFNTINDPASVAKSGFEPGYLLLCKLFHGIGLSYWVMVFFISFLVLFLFYKATESQTKNAGIALMVGLFYFFYPSLEALRQTIAVAIFFFSLKYMKKKPLYYFLLNLTGMLFHRTAALALFFFFFQRYLWVKIASLALVAIFPFIRPFMLKLLEFSPVLLEKFVWYAGNSGSFSHLLSFKVLETAGLFTLFYLLPNKTEKEQTISNLMALGVWVHIFLPMVMDGAYRFGYYSDIGVILAYCNIYDRLPEKHYRWIYTVILILYIAFRFVRLITANPNLFAW